MKTLLPAAAAALVLSGSFYVPANAQVPALPPANTSSAAIDADVWSVISATVVSGDIVGMSGTYHPDAVVVTPKKTQPVNAMLAIWGRDMENMKRNGSKATVAFRFTKRQDDTTSAFESGMFNYVSTDKTGKVNSFYIPFEALLVLKDGKWRTVLERQFAEVTVAEWDKLPH